MEEGGHVQDVHFLDLGGEELVQLFPDCGLLETWDGDQGVYE